MSARWRPPAVLATLLAFAMLFGSASLLYPGFASLRVCFDLLGDNAVLGVVAVGMTLVILSGGIDLSVGSMVALASIALAVQVQLLHVPPVVAIGSTLAGGVVAGATMGALVQYLAIPGFIATLAGMFLFRGTALAMHLESVSIEHWQWLTAAGVSLGSARLTVPALVFVGVTAASAFLVSRTRMGRSVLALGGNEQAAALLGIDVGRTRVAVYAISGLCAALGGVLLTVLVSAGNPTAGVGLELEAIAAVVVGGTRLSGGVGSVLGTFVGVMIFGVIQEMVTFQGTLSSGWIRVAIGALLLGFVAVQRLLQRGGAR